MFMLADWVNFDYQIELCWMKRNNHKMHKYKKKLFSLYSIQIIPYFAYLIIIYVALFSRDQIVRVKTKDNYNLYSKGWLFRMFVIPKVR